MTNIFENIKIQDIVLVILVLLVVYLLFRNNSCTENFDATSELNKFFEPIKNLGAISAKIMDSKGNLSIPSNTIMEGNLNVKGNITLDGNSQKSIVLTCALTSDYVGPILDEKGFPIPFNKYWSTGSEFVPYLIGYDSIRTEDIKYYQYPPQIYGNIDTNEWWVMRNYYSIYDENAYYTFKFTPRNQYTSNSILPTIKFYSGNKKPFVQSGIIRVLNTIPQSYDSGTETSNYLVQPTKNTTDKNPYL